MNTFEPGDIVICYDSHGYAFTKGKEYTVVDYIKEYTVVDYIPEFYDRDTPSGFTYPAYLDIIDNSDRRVRCHASRFLPKT